MTQLVDTFAPSIREELLRRGVKIKSVDSIAKSQVLPEIFENFPRSLPLYSQIISTLSDIAAYDVTKVINYLTQTTANIIQRKPTKLFSSLPKPENNSVQAEFYRIFLLLMISDVICTILYEHNVPENPIYLINCGIYICMSTFENKQLAVLLLKQWSVIFSKISYERPAQLFDRLTQLIVNQSDLFFLLMRYVRLDAPASPAADILDIINLHFKKARKRGALSSSLFISLSSVVSTWKGDPSVIQQFYNVGMQYCEQPNKCPGAVYLVSVLIPIMGWNEEQIEKFYQEKVYPLAKTEEGLPVSIRALRRLMYGNEIDPDFHFWVWGPKARPHSFTFLNWNRENNLKDHRFLEIFMKYYFDSAHYAQCSPIIRDVLVAIASYDFDAFQKKVIPEFLGLISLDSDRFMTFLNTIPMINDKEFISIANVSEADIKKFNQDIGTLTVEEILKVLPKKEEDFGIFSEQFELYRKKTELATHNVTKLFENWKISPGTSVELRVVGASKSITPQSTQSAQSHHIIKIIPYALASENFMTDDVRRNIILLSASADSAMSKPAYQISLSLIQSSEQRPYFLEQLVKMVDDVRRQPEIVFVCLSLLIEAMDQLEPTIPSNEKSLEYRIEFVAFLAFASSNPLVRILGFKLLEKINKLLQNQGLYSRAEDHLAAISSNVKHNILSQLLPDRPGHIDYREEEISLEDALSSRYQLPWLFYLVEFGRCIVSSNYLPIIMPIADKCRDFQICNRKPNHYDLGLFVIFFSTCIVEENVDKSLYVYEMPKYSEGKIPTFIDPLKTIMTNILTHNNKEYFDILCTGMIHANYTIVPNIIQLLYSRFFSITLSSKNKLDSIQSIYMVLHTIEGNNNLKKKVFHDTQEIMTNLMHTFNSEKLNKISFLGSNEPNILTDEKLPKNEFAKYERQIISYLAALTFWLETDDVNEEINNWSLNVKQSLLRFLLNWANITKKQKNNKCSRIKLYAARALVPLISSGPIITDKVLVDSIPQLLIDCSNCERAGYHILLPLLENNTKILFSYFIDSCFTRKSVIADFFADAIYYSMPKEIQDDNNLYYTNAGSLFLLGLFRTRTGSMNGKNMLQQYCMFYAHQIHYTDEKFLHDMKTLPIGDIPAKHFIRVSEPLVFKALELMKDKKFKGTTKAMVDILKPWIKHFRILPNQGMCVPSVNTTGWRLTPKIFLDLLLGLTKQKEDEHDFNRLVELWATLLSVIDHESVVPVYISEFGDPPEIRTMLFDRLIDRPQLARIVVKRLAKRCKFSYYAFVSYQRNNDFDKEFWMIPVIMKAVKYKMNECLKYLPIIIHFALLFHSNQTQSLLKRLCKILDVPYSRRTLSTGSVRKIVRQFQDAINNKLKNPSEEMLRRPSTPDTRASDDEENNNEDQMKNKEQQAHKIDIPPIIKWATEAMRWTIGCNNLKIAHTSLIILNQLEYSIDQETTQELLHGICKSVAFFLSQVNNKDNQTYEFINETFRLFKRHFEGNEFFALNYIKSYLSFVISVDAYFSQMIPLYVKCQQSEITKNESAQYLLPVLRPTFNELEADSKIRKKINEKFLNQCSPSLTEYQRDLMFVQAALIRANQRDAKSDEELINFADYDQLNRALLHYSLMVDTASTDMKRRILSLSTMILSRIGFERAVAKNAFTTRTNSSTYYSKPTEEAVTQHQEEEEENQLPVQISEADKNDLNKPALVIIFRAAIKLLPGMKEALDFVIQISKIDPLIPTMPLIDEMDWKAAAAAVIEDLKEYGEQENGIVTLTDCVHLGSTSNLLNKDSSPKILPFTTQSDMLQSILGKTENNEGNSGQLIENWVRKITTLGYELHKKISDRVTPNRTIVNGHYDLIPFPEELVPDEKLVKPQETKVEICQSTDEFLKSLVDNTV